MDGVRRDSTLLGEEGSLPRTHAADVLLPAHVRRQSPGPCPALVVPGVDLLRTEALCPHSVWKKITCIPAPVTAVGAPARRHLRVLRRRQGAQLHANVRGALECFHPLRPCRALLHATRLGEVHPGPDVHSWIVHDGAYA
eukprot:scaffold1562_cov146-Isochrysis_galbana.AAC.5